MNQSSPSPDSSDGKSADHREMFVTTDYGSMPASEIRPLAGSFGAWMRAVISYKLLRSKSNPPYVLDLRRFMRAKHVPKRMQKHFEELKKDLQPLSFGFNFFATIPSIGPYTTLTMAMSRRDGDLHFLAVRTMAKSEARVEDDGHLEFRTWLADGTCVVTASPCRLPLVGPGVDRVVLHTEDPAALLKKHRERLQKKEVETIPPADLFDRVEADHQKETEDLLRRRVVRLATMPEVSRIRAEM